MIWNMVAWILVGVKVVGTVLIGLAFLVVLAITLDPYFRFPGG